MTGSRPIPALTVTADAMHAAEGGALPDAHHGAERGGSS